MLHFKKEPAHFSLFLILITTNILLYLTWFWLRSIPFHGDSSDPYIKIKNGRTYLNRPALMRNESYLATVFDNLHKNKMIFFLGTSESNTSHNLAAQMNAMKQDAPRMFLIASGGMSPIHSCLAFARARRDSIDIPPIVLLINPTYFTQSHDAINESWLSRIVPSPTFILMNHHNICDFLNNDVRKAYNEHFGIRKVLTPVLMQEYLGNLIYLVFHRPTANEQPSVPLPVPFYNFDGVLPDYDKIRNVWTGYRASDQLNKSRWDVKPAKDCVNLKGLAFIISVLQSAETPVLILVLPTNKTFYRYNGLNMEDYDRHYASIREAIREMTNSKNIYLIDLYDSPKLDLGFMDRMHTDQYGNFQLARYIVNSKEYSNFTNAVQKYYEK